MNDLKFLKEMRSCTRKLLKEKYDIILVEHLDKMIEDWIDDLSNQSSGVGVAMPKIADIKRSETLGVWESIRERFVCSNCGAEEITDSYSYCPNCGIKINFIE